MCHNSYGGNSVSHFFEWCYEIHMNTQFWEKLAVHAKEGPRLALVSIISSKGSTPQTSGNKMMVFPSGDIHGTIGGGALEFQVTKLAVECIQKNKNMRKKLNLTYDLGMCCGGIVEVFIEIITPQNQLVIYGAGHVGMALATLAQRLDYHVHLVESRIDFTTPPPGITYREEHPLQILNQLPFGEHCDHFITTHEHKLDQDILQALRDKKIRYLGMIGSKTKKEKFRFRFRAAEWGEDIFTKLHTPAGLNISAQTPMEIAVSIAAELIQYRHNHP